MFNLIGTNPTQVIGVLVFTAAALACSGAARRTSGRAAAVWKALMVLQFVFVAEVVFGLRHRIHDLVDAMLQAQGWYWQRQPVQQALVLATAGLAALGLVAVSRLRHLGQATSVALVSTFLVGVLFALEMVSLHRIDALMYHRVGPVMLIAWLWAAGAATVGCCSLRVR